MAATAKKQAVPASTRASTPRKGPTQETKAHPKAAPAAIGEDDDSPKGLVRRAETTKIPLVSVIDDQDTVELSIALLKEAAELKQEVDKKAARLAEIKEQLSDIAEGFDLPGIRYGNIGLEYHGWRGSKRLNKEMLLLNGVSPDVIASSYKESDKYRDSRFVNILL